MRAIVDYSTEPVEPFASIEVEPAAQPYPCPSEWHDRIMIDVSHDGAYIPAEFLVDGLGDPIDPRRFRRQFELERDWGANMVAERIVAALGLGRYYRINVARVLLDFGRFPGITRVDRGHMRRFAINYPFSELLSWEQMRALLENYYDPISDAIDPVVRNRLIKIAVHTYDAYNPSGTPRPPVSLVTRAFNYQSESRMPHGVFDELCPDSLGEFTCDRLLRDRISLTLEKADIPVSHNYPYLLPEGAIEVRSQVWFFFHYLQEQFEQTHPETSHDPAYQWVWEMLFDTNLRSSRSGALRSYVHMFRRVKPEQEAEFEAARHAYERVREFLEREHHIIEEYRFSQARQSSIAIEVRKDLIWRFDEKDRPLGPRPAGIAQIGDAIAKAVSIYLTRDRLEMQERAGRYWGDRVVEEDTG